MNELLLYDVDAADMAVVFGYWLLMYAIGFVGGVQLRVLRGLLDAG